MERAFSQRTPKSILNELKDLIKRYSHDAVIRELIQNADDAGAKRFVAALLKCNDQNDQDDQNGQAVGEHVRKLMMERPFLVVVNDGPFSSAHARGIRSLHDSHKMPVDQAHTPVGKFGLGMKSIFNWAETFFVVHLGGGTTVAPFGVIPGETETNGVLDPDAKGYNIAQTRRWRELQANKGFPGSFRSEVDDLVTSLGVGSTEATSERLVFLIPLREVHRTARDKGLRNDNYYPVTIQGSIEQPSYCVEDFWNTYFRDDWNRQWPLLVGASNLETVRFLKRSDAEFMELSATAASGSGRPRRTEGETTVQVVLNPSTPEQSPEQRVVSTTAEDSTLPVVRNSGSLPTALMNHEGWPTSLNEDDQDAEAVDRAIPPEAAIWVYELPDVDANATPLGEARWACALPLAGKSQDEQNDPTKGRRGRVQIVLHGAFEVDSSRTRVALDQSDNGQPSFRTAWNRWLMLDRILPLMPRTVARFLGRTASSVTSDAAKVRAVNEAIAGLQGPSISELGKDAFWNAVTAGGIVVPVLCIENNALQIRYEHIASGTQLLRFQLQTLENLTTLSTALPGLVDLVNSSNNVRVMVVSTSLPTFPASLPQDRFTAWTPGQVFALRPDPEGKGLLDGLELVHGNCALLFVSPPDSLVVQWLRALLCHAFDAHLGVLAGLSDQQRTAVRELAILCGPALRGPAACTIDLETRLRQVLLEVPQQLQDPPILLVPHVVA